MSKGKHIYTAAEISSYHAGTMPLRQMHELEKAALADPFLADALEGYLHSKDTAGEIRSLTERMGEAMGKSKMRRMFFTTSWARVAAMIVLIAGGAYVLYTLKIQDIDRPIAMHEQTKPHLAPDTTLFMDSPGKKQEQVKPLLQEATQPTERVLADNNSTKPASTVTKQPGVKVFQRQASEQEASIVYFGETNTDTEISPQAAASIARASKMDSALSIEKSKRELSTAARKNALTRAAIKKDTAISVGLSQPADFKKYMGKYSERMHAISGLTDSIHIELAFKLDTLFKPAEIRIIQSNCAACNSEAIRLLMQGPPWSGSPGDTTRVQLSW